MPNHAIGEVIQHLRSILLPEGAELTDAQLLECFLSRREPAALEALVRRHGPLVWGVCRRVLGDRHDAEDAFQATFLVLVRKAASVHPRSKVGAWLYGVARRTALKSRAVRAKRQERERSVNPMPEPAVAEPEVQSDLQAMLDEEISRLPEHYRDAIVLCELGGKTVKEAAKQLGCPEGTVASRLARGRALLARRLSWHGLAVSGGALAAALFREAKAAVPASVVNSTIKAVTAVAAGQAAVAGAVPVKVAILMEGMLKTMFWTKLRSMTAVTVALVVTVGIGAGLLAYGTAAGEQSEGKKSDAVAPQKAIARTDKDQLQGKWLAISGKCNGENRMQPWIEDNVLLVIEERDGKLVCEHVAKDKSKLPEDLRAEALWKYTQCTLKQDTRTKPKTLDATGVHGNGTYLGIYALDGDTLTWCQSKALPPGAAASERPTDFSTKRGDGRTLSVYKRQKETGAKSSDSSPVPAKKADAGKTDLDRLQGIVSADSMERGGKSKVRIVATVNGEAIHAEEVYAAAYLSLPDAQNPAAPDRSQRIMAVWRNALDHVVEREVVLQAAFAALKARNAKAVEKLQEVAANEFGQRWVKAATRNAGLKDDEELNASLRAQGMSLDAVRRQWERDFMAEEYLRSRVLRRRDPGATPSEEDARQERARIVAELKRQAVIEYAGGR